MINFENCDIRDILNCTGIVLPEQKPIAPPKSQKRPKKDPKLRWHAGVSQGQTQEEADRISLEQEKYWYNRDKLKVGRVSSYLTQNDGKWYLYIVGPKVLKGKPGTMKKVNIPIPTKIFFHLINSAYLYVAKSGEIVARIPINPDAVADIPLYDIPDKKS